MQADGLYSIVTFRHGSKELSPQKVHYSKALMITTLPTDRISCHPLESRGQ